MEESRRLRRGQQSAGTLSDGAKGAGRAAVTKLRGEAERLAQGLTDRLLAQLGTEREAFGEHEFRLDADEVEGGGEIALDELERGRGRAFAVDAATRQRD